MGAVVLVEEGRQALPQGGEAGDQGATPARRVLDALGVQPGDQLEIEEGPGGFTIRPRRIDPTRLAPLRGKLLSGQEPLDLESFREQPYDPALRD